MVSLRETYATSCLESREFSSDENHQKTNRHSVLAGVCSPPTVMRSIRVTAQFADAGRVRSASVRRTDLHPPCLISLRARQALPTRLRGASIRDAEQVGPRAHRWLARRRGRSPVCAGLGARPSAGQLPLCRSGRRSDQRYVAFANVVLDFTRIVDLACSASAVFLSADQHVGSAAQPWKRRNPRLSPRPCCLEIAAASVRAVIRSRPQPNPARQVTDAGTASCDHDPPGQDPV
jgi:hypothetical protein